MISHQFEQVGILTFVALGQVAFVVNCIGTSALSTTVNPVTVTDGVAEVLCIKTPGID